MRPATSTSFSLSVTLKGFQGLVMGRAVQKTMDAEVAALAKLRQVLEG